MEPRLTAIEMTGTVDKHNRLTLDEPLPIAGPKRVRVIVLYTSESETSDMRADLSGFEEDEWLQGAAHNPVFQYLKDQAEDIYTREDGKPFAR